MPRILTRKRLLNGWFLSAIVAGIVLAAYGFYWRDVRSFVVSIDQCDILYCDFFRHFYPMGREILATNLPVEGFFYSPFAALLFAWTANASSRSAFLLWSLVQAISAAGLYLLPMLNLIQNKPNWQVFYTFIFFTSLPLLHNLKWGQVSVLIAFLVLAALYLYERGYRFWSAALLATAIAIKYYPAIFLIYFLLRRDMRYLVTCALIIIVFLMVLPGVLLGIEPTVQFYHLTQAASAKAMENWMRQDLNTQYLGRVALRLFRLGDDAWLETGLRFLGFLISLLNIILLRSLVRRQAKSLIYWTWSLLFSTLPFWLVTSWPHYFVYLPLAQIFLLLEIDKVQLLPWQKAALGIFSIASILFSNTLIFILVGRWQLYSKWGFLFFANALLMAGSLALSAVLYRQGRIAKQTVA